MVGKESTRSYLNALTGKGPFCLPAGRGNNNILLITVDMVPPEFYLPWKAQHEASGLNVAAETPNLERLKRDGAFFTNAFCCSPLCTPSRASYLTGRYSYITTNSERAHDGHQVSLRDDDVIFPEYLKATGYRVRHVGKSHVGTHKFMDVFGENDSPWDRWSPPWFDDDGYYVFLQGMGLSRFSFARSIYGKDPSGTGNGNFYGGWIAAQQGKPFTLEATYSYYLVEQAIEALEAGNKEQPFYLQLDFFAPHQPFAIPGGMEEREREIRRQIGLPASYAAIRENSFKPPWPEPRVYGLYRKNWGLEEPSILLDYRVAHLLQLELIDQALARLFSYLEERGLYERLWIFLLADHGEMNGEGSLIDKGAFINPQVMRVPLIIKPPASLFPFLQGKTVDAPVSLLDLAPTILELAGVDTEERLDGASLLADSPPELEQRPIMADIWAHVVPNPCVATVFRASDEGLYLFSYNAADDLDELYRLNTPMENRNIIGDRVSREVLEEAFLKMDTLLAADVRWRAYSSAFRLEYAEKLPFKRGDRQLFVK